jgi:8-oxo-dGTP diphosphatase
MEDCPNSVVDLDRDLPTLLVAAVALVDLDTQVLITKRPEGKSMAGLWEFPGGKVEDGELFEAALIREIKEELDIDVGVGCLQPFSFASHSYQDFHLFMPLYLCRNWRGQIKPLEGQEIAWVKPKLLRTFEMPPADVGIASMLRDFL